MKPLRLLFCLVLIASCGTKETPKNDQFITVNFDQAIPKKLVNNEISDELGFTFLHYDEEHPIGQIRTYKITKNFIVLADSQQKLFVFKKNGALFSMIDRKGNGPSEYVEIEDFSISSNEETILILDPKNLKILSYTIDGTYESHRKMDYAHAAHISLLANGNMVLYQSARFSEKNENIFILNPDFSVVHSAFDPEGEILTALPYLLGAMWYQHNSNTYYKEALVDTVYKIGNLNRVKPHMVLDFGSKRMPNDFYTDVGLFQKNSSNHYQLGSIRESRQYVFFLMLLHNNRHYFLYDKTSSGGMSFNLGTAGLSGNFQSDLGFWPQYIDDNDTMYMFMDAGDLAEKLETIPDAERIKDVLATNDNPVLLSSKLN